MGGYNNDCQWDNTIHQSSNEKDVRQLYSLQHWEKPIPLSVMSSINGPHEK